MPTSLENGLRKAAALTFEELSFMLPTEMLNEHQRAAQAAIAATISFRGAFGGTLAVLVCGEVLPLLSANMLGEDSPPDQNLQFDALQEIANVICGNVLPELAGSDAVFDIGPAQIMTPKQARSCSKLMPAAELHVGLDQGRVELRLYLDDPNALTGQPPRTHGA